MKVAIVELTEKEENEIAEAIKVHGVTATAELYSHVSPSALMAIRAKHGIARRAPGPRPFTAADHAASFSPEDINKVKNCRSISEALRVLGLSTSATTRLKGALEHHGIAMGVARYTPDAVAKRFGYGTVAKLSDAMLLMNNTEAGSKFGMTKEAAARLRVALGLPMAKNGRAFRKSISQAPKPTPEIQRTIAAAHEQLGSWAARQKLCHAGLDRKMVNRALLELDAADALTPEAQIATFSRREVKVLFDPYLTAEQVAKQIKSISVDRATALRRALGVSKDALGSVMRKEGKSREQIQRLIEFERLEEAARLINVPSKVVVEATSPRFQ